MLRGRLILLMAAGLLLYVPCPVASGPGVSRSRATAALALDRGQAEAISLLLNRPSPPRTLGRFTIWKARPKIVLAERDPLNAEEADLGPAPAPNCHSLCSTSVHAVPRPSARPLLRC